MSNEATWRLTSNDRAVLRALAARQREIAEEPVMAERQRLWLKHAAYQGERPMILAETGGVLDELVPASALQCEEGWARGMERGFRDMVFRHEQVGDDHVVLPYVQCNWQVSISNYGVASTHTRGDNAGKLASYRWDPPLKNLQGDFEKLHPRTCSVDREATMARKAFLEELFDGILPVRIRGGFWWTMGLTIVAIDLIGLEQLMLYMYDDPDGLRRLMAFLRDDHIAVADWLEREGLLTLNNENDYIGSGSEGFTAELPQPDAKPGAPVRLRDQWVLSESQETVGVSPQLFEEFVFPYQLPIIERFGLCYYGCCEPVHSRVHILQRLPNLRRISVSPWADEAAMGEACRGRYAFCRKPNPAQVSTARFEQDFIREDLRRTLRAAKGCMVEFAMKDVHTVAEQPWRLGRWVQLAREVSAEFA